MKKNYLYLLVFFSLIKNIITNDDTNTYATKEELNKKLKEIENYINLHQNKDINFNNIPIWTIPIIALGSFLVRNILEYSGHQYGKYIYENVITNPLEYPLFLRKYLFNNFFNKKKSRKIMFSDIGGYQDIKNELLEIMSDIKNPNNKKNNMTGILLWGPPGTGKTYLAEAIANESGYSLAIIDSTDINSSPLLGESEIQLKKILMEAKDNKPSIIFIDEIENLLSNRKEEKSTLKSSFNSLKNIFLTYMDGGKENMDQVVLIGATNSIDDIDPAFVRPGRFEHIFKIDFPTYKDRFEILEILLKKNNLSLNSDITLQYIAEKTSGFTGADINKLFTILLKINKNFNDNIINQERFIEAYLQSTLGKKDKHIILNKEEKKNTAIHESGHCLLEFILNKSNNGYFSFDFVTISPRSNTLGTSHSKESMEYKSWTKEYAKNQISILLAGRAAQEIILNKQDSGASNDLEKATIIAENMIIKSGFGKNISQKHHKDKMIDEINEIINTEYKKITSFFIQHKELLLKISDELINKETLYKKDIEMIVSNYEKEKNIKLVY
jgi:cell division protease FtsH